jgi:hypothetical protein
VRFGLIPEFIGQGLGRYFLQWTIDKAWRSQPRRFWLHTCTQDHPAALPNYLKAGFVAYKEEVKDHGRNTTAWTVNQRTVSGGKTRRFR